MRQELLTGIRPGDVVRDVVSGIEGLATGVCLHLTGCDTVGISRPVGADGKVPEPYWADANRLEVVKRNGVTLPGWPAPPAKREPARSGAMGDPTASRSNPS